MKPIFPAAGCLALALVTSFAFPAAVSSAPAGHKTVTCPFLKEGRVTFDVPVKRGDLPQIDFDYPAKATSFSFRDGNLSLVAMDESEPSRLRVVVSAQLNKKQIPVPEAERGRLGRIVKIDLRQVSWLCRNVDRQTSFLQKRASDRLVS